MTDIDDDDDELRAWLARQRLSLQIQAATLGGLDNPVIRSALRTQLQRERERLRYALSGQAHLAAEVAKARKNEERWQALLQKVREDKHGKETADDYQR